MAECSARVRAKRTLTDASHIQFVAEASFLDLDYSGDLRYVRACAGFGGFAAGSVNLEFIERFSADMNRITGPRWRTWGSEQVMSNVVIANAKDAAVLPHPTYGDCMQSATDMAFIHFIGDCRFVGSKYARLASSTVRTLIP